MSVLRVYKFYDAHNAVRNLTQRRLKISTLDDLNDPFEFRSISFSNMEFRGAWERARSKLFEDKGIICFCGDWRNPVIWSHYANNHKGLALGFDIPKKHLIKVRYRKTRLKVSDLRGSDPNYREKKLRKNLFTKFDHWRYENEYRIFVAADCIDEKTGLYFKRFDKDLVLKEVVFGSQSDLTKPELIRKTKITNATFVTTRLAFNSFEVVRQRNRILQK